MVFDRDRAPSHLPFSIVRKGFDRDEVTNYFARFEAELRVTATDRDAASAQARDLARSWRTPVMRSTIYARMSIGSRCPRPLRKA